VARFIAACNANDTVPRFLEGQGYKPRKAIPTHANAMDVADPSNFVRILELLGKSPEACRSILSAATFDDAQTSAAIRTVHHHDHYLLDPHGAIGYLALDEWQRKHQGQKGYFLGTAHPVKFPDCVEQATGQPIPLPDAVLGIMAGQKQSTPIPPRYDAVKAFLETLI
jgi:threonine synthase